MSEQRRAVREREAFLAFYDRTLDEAYRYAARLCGHDRDAAEDLVQDAYLGVLRQFQEHPERELTVGYVVTTVRHRFLDRMKVCDREERRLRLVATTDASNPADDADTGIEAAGTMPARLASLPDRDRAALVLRYVDDLSVPEVAEAMGLSVHAAESLLARARTRLRGREARDA